MLVLATYIMREEQLSTKLNGILLTKCDFLHSQDYLNKNLQTSNNLFCPNNRQKTKVFTLPPHKTKKSRKFCQLRG